MPELPEVETVCLALSKVVNNAKIVKTEIFRKNYSTKRILPNKKRKRNIKKN